MHHAIIWYKEPCFSNSRSKTVLEPTKAFTIAQNKKAHQPKPLRLSLLNFN